MMRIELPGWHAVPKKRPRVTRNGTYMPPGYMDWKQETAFQMRLAARGAEPAVGLLRVEVLLVAKKKPRGDMDNLLGAVLDAGNGVLWQDDRLVGACSCAWLKPTPERGEGVYVEVDQWTIA
jgi:Holliday junction resolvase RusA-like endonuclease